MADYVLGLDLNHYRKDVNIKQAKSQGVRFILNKCTEGTTFFDETYLHYQAEAQAKNMPFGGYLYWRYRINPVAQAKFFCEKLGEVQFRPIVDVERINNTKVGSKTEPIVSVAANRAHLKIVLDTIELETGVKPMIYTNYATWFHIFANWEVITEYEVWVANWRLSHNPYMPNPATKWVLHQWTNAYTVLGYPRGIDANWFNGNEGDFEAYIEEVSALWNPIPDPDNEEFMTDILIMIAQIVEDMETQDDLIAILLDKIAKVEKQLYDAGAVLIE